jgi:hypothetical protein
MVWARCCATPHPRITFVASGFVIAAQSLSRLSLALAA